MYKIRIEHAGDELVVRTAYELKDLMKRIPGYKWDKREKAWRYPEGALIGLMENFGNDFSVYPDKRCIERYKYLRSRAKYVEQVKELKKSELEAQRGLYHHQEQAVQIGLAHEHYAFFLGIGSGKTRTMLELISRLKDAGEIERVLVVAPISILNAAWVEDCERWTPELTIRNLYGKNKKQRDAQLDYFLSCKMDIAVINWEGFKIQRNKLEQAGFDVLILDESTKIKNSQSQISKALTEFGLGIKRRYILTGSPCPQGEIDLFSQIRFLDASIFGGFITHFKNVWFQPQNMFKQHVTKWMLQPAKKDRFLKKLERISFTVPTEKCIDLPGQIFKKHEFPLDKKCSDLYVQLRDDMVMRVNDELISPANCLAQTIKLRQVSSGFVFNDEREALSISSKKLDVMDDILAEHEPRTQYMIMFQFREELRMLQEYFKKKKMKISELHGGIAGGKKDIEIRKFKSGSAQVMLLHPASAMFGITFTNCHVAIWFGIPWSYEQFTQSNGRIYRSGQKTKCIYHMILSRLATGGMTIDHRVVKALRTKKLGMDEVINILSKKVGE